LQKFATEPRKGLKINKSILISNPWTQIDHGHARNELNLVKELANSFLDNCEIVSESENFGDIFIEANRSMLSALPQALKRGIVFRELAKDQIRTYAKGLSNYLEKIDTKQIHLILTSAKVDHLQILQYLNLNRLNISVRLIAPPLTREEINIFNSVIRLKSAPNLRIVFETSDGARRASKFFYKDFGFVPPAQGLVADSLNWKENTHIGIFWPVSYFENETQVVKILDEMREFECVVRLPGNADTPKIRLRYPKFDFINRGISDAQFLEYIKRTKIALLPHRNYYLRGSGLASTLAGYGVPIISSSSNSFFSDLSSHAQIFEMESNLNQQVKELHGLTPLAPNERNGYLKWTTRLWTEFIGDTK